MNILGELRVPLEFGSLIRSRVWRGGGVLPGNGERVLTIPGLLVGDETLWPMRRWLGRLGYKPLAAGMRLNVHCSERQMTVLIERLERAVEIDGRRAHVLGQSRGGMLAHVLAVRRPDLVASVSTLGAPISATLDDFHPLLRRSLVSLTRLGDGREGILNSGCWAGAPGSPAPGTTPLDLLGDDTCCRGFWPDLAAPLPDGVLGTAIYSDSDGVVAARGCVAPGYRPVRIVASHAGMATNPGAYRAIAETIGEAAAREAREPRRPALAPRDLRPPAPTAAPAG